MLKKITKINKNSNLIILGTAENLTKAFEFNERENDFIHKQIENNQKIISINRFDFYIFIVVIGSEKNESLELESIRALANKSHSLITNLKIESITIIGESSSKQIIAFAEGLLLSNYQYLKYFSDADKRKYSLNNINILNSEIKDIDIKNITYISEAGYKCRDLVNETGNILTSSLLAKEFKKMGKEAGFDVKVFEKEKIEKLKMGGILSINRGSAEPPTFTVMTWKPSNAMNAKPIVLVGKGVTYDTGGLSLKPTTSMDTMKADMSGSAAISSAIYAIAKMKLNVYVIGLVPSTDNRVNAESIAPGDVVRMYNGSTVEIMNTDAEGRMLLADALSYADEFNPELVIDMATLTGAAANALGKYSAVVMGNAGDKVVADLKTAGHNIYERLVEFPFWDDYAELLKSDIADQKNIGGPAAGAITAGKFLEKFVKAPYVHIDIAGSAFFTQADSYRGKGATGFGVRLLVEYISNYAKNTN